MLNTNNCFIPPESNGETLKWIGRLALTIAAGIILSQFGVRLPDNLKL